MTIEVRAGHFSGASKVYEDRADGLAQIVRGMAQNIAKVAAAAVTGLTDNSGGAAADGTIGAIGLVTPSAIAPTAAATGSITFTGLPLADETVTVNGVAFTAKASGATGAQFNIGADVTETALNFATVLNASVHASISVATYTPALGVVSIAYDTAGTAGNAFTLTEAATNVTLSGATLTGGLAHTGAQKAELEASFGNVRDALTELAAQINVIAAKVPAASVTGTLGGAAADLTIAAIDASMTAVSTSLASAAGTNALVSAYRDVVATLAAQTNRLAVACGLSELTDSSGGTPVYSGALPALVTTTGTAVTGADATANAGVLATGANTMLASFAAAVKELATKLNACTSASTGYLVANVIAR